MNEDTNSKRGILEEAKYEIINNFSETILLYGFSPSEARLFGTIFFEEKPMTLDEMSDALSMSKTSMSTGIRSLLDAKMVERVWRKGVRKDLFKAEENLQRTFVNGFIKPLLTKIQDNHHSLLNKRKQLEEISQNTDNNELIETTKHYINKINQIIDFYHWLESSLSNYYNDQKEPSS